MGNILWEWVLRTDRCHTNIGSFARFGERIVARVKVFAFLQRIGDVSLTAPVLYKEEAPDLKLILEKVVAVGKLAVKAEEFLLFLVEGLHSEH